MITPAYAHTLAAYNRWQNQQLYACCAGLDAEALQQDRGAFFRSIIGTLNHLLLADRIWLGRFLAEPYAARALDEILFVDLQSLRQAREATDRQIDNWAATLTEGTLMQTLEYTSLVGNEPRSLPFWLAVTHFFNHQTHHRGQVTTLLSQSGIDVGVTDLPWMPDLDT